MDERSERIAKRFEPIVTVAALLVALTAFAGGTAFAELEKGQSTANGV
jgi:hypothetical protein